VFASLCNESKSSLITFTIASFKEDKNSQIFHSQCPNCKLFMFAKPNYSDGANDRQNRLETRKGSFQLSFYNPFNKIIQNLSHMDIRQNNYNIATGEKQQCFICFVG